jgi:hypothetical protein
MTDGKKRTERVANSLSLSLFTAGLSANDEGSNGELGYAPAGRLEVRALKDQETATLA